MFLTARERDQVENAILAFYYRQLRTTMRRSRKVHNTTMLIGSTIFLLGMLIMALVLPRDAPGWYYMAPWVLLVIVFWLGDTGRKKIWNHRFEYDDYKFHIEEIVACEVTVAERQLFLELVQDLLLGIDEDIYESTKRVVQSPTLSKITFVRELHANELHRRS